MSGATNDLHQPAGPSTDAIVNDRSEGDLRQFLAAPGDRVYHPCPEASPADDVPRSAVASYKGWDRTEVFAGTTRTIWVSTPAGFDPAGDPPALLVCQDGIGYLHRDGAVRAAAVLDSLMHAGELPPTVGVFVNPGQRGDGGAPAGQRSVEYDSVNDDYGRFLDDEVLPFVEAELGTSLSTDPSQRTICGISSGGICAFNVAFHRPESFGRVISHCGSFTNIRGGHEYPFWVRAMDRRPIKVYLQSGAADLDIPRGSWPLANKMLADSLAYAGYDHRFEFGTGGHTLRHGGAAFADTLRWLESSDD